ncbi:hypothetical protein C0995_001122 [Termitomyces sp. Mi166|nr:hypothetical protein C0995_001122 [Termitomyces sp. Mi166\
MILFNKGTFTKEQIQALQANSDAEVYEDVILTSAAIQKYQFTYEYDSFAGQNVDVYVIDSGVYIKHAAAGNDAQRVNNVSSAHIQDVITVAASNISDQQASISNWGEGVNIFAPGEKITSLGIQGPDAAAHVSGLAATFLEGLYNSSNA